MKRRFFLRGAGFSFILAIVSFQACYAELLPKQDAPDFSLTNTEGKEVTLKNILRGKKAILINFWATWCSACKHEIPQLIALQTKYAGKSFSVFGIGVGESVKKATMFQERFSMNYPIVIDHDSEVAKKYGVVGLPVSVLIDANGEVLEQYHEYSDQLEKDVEKVLS